MTEDNLINGGYYFYPLDLFWHKPWYFGFSPLNFPNSY